MKKIIEVYKHTCKNGMQAEVTFREDENGIFGFSNCTYTPSNHKYTIKDWEDLHELSEEVLKLDSRYNLVYAE
jgi:hypothetical protein